MSFLRNSRAFLALVGITIGACFAIVTWRMYRDRQAPLCAPAQVCRFNDIALQGKAPRVSAEVLQPLFAQPLFFSEETKHCTLYETTDGQFVLKLFKKPLTKRGKKRLEERIMGGIIGRTLIPEETGILACVCNPQIFPLPTVTILTATGDIEKIALRNIPFLFQQKAQPFQQTLMRLIAEKKTEEAAARIESFFLLLTQCREKGVLDRGGSLIFPGSIGFVNGKAMLLDSGRLCRCSNRKRITFHELHRLRAVQSWLTSACPTLVPLFSSCREQYRASVIEGEGKKGYGHNFVE